MMEDKRIESHLKLEIESSDRAQTGLDLRDFFKHCSERVEAIEDLRDVESFAESVLDVRPIIHSCHLCRIQPEIVEVSIIDPNDLKMQRVLAIIIIPNVENHGESIAKSYKAEMKMNVEQAKGPIVPHRGLYDFNVWEVKIPGIKSCAPRVDPKLEEFVPYITSYRLGSDTTKGEIRSNIRDFVNRFYSGLRKRHKEVADGIDRLRIVPFPAPPRGQTATEMGGGAVFVWGRELPSDGKAPKDELRWGAIFNLMSRTILKYSVLQAERAKVALRERTTIIKRVKHALTAPLAAERTILGNYIKELDIKSLPPKVQTIVKRLETRLMTLKIFCDTLQILDGGVDKDLSEGWAPVNYVALNVIEEIHAHPRFERVASRIAEPKISGTPRYSQGSWSLWHIVFWVLLQNALEATPDERSESIQIRLDYPHSGSRSIGTPTMSITVTNPVDTLPKERRVLMNDALANRIQTLPPNKEKASSLGVGLATAGQLIKAIGADAEVFYDHQEGIIEIRLKKVRVGDATAT